MLRALLTNDAVKEEANSQTWGATTSSTRETNTLIGHGNLNSLGP